MKILETSRSYVSEVIAFADSVAFLCVANVLPFLITFVCFLQLYLQTFYNFLAEVRSLCEFLFYFFVNLDFALVCLDLLLHFVVLEDKNFSLLRLVLQLSSQLVVLQNS